MLVCHMFILPSCYITSIMLDGCMSDHMSDHMGAIQYKVCNKSWDHVGSRHLSHIVPQVHSIPLFHIINMYLPLFHTSIALLVHVGLLRAVMGRCWTYFGLFGDVCWAPWRSLGVEKQPQTNLFRLGTGRPFLRSTCGAKVDPCGVHVGLCWCNVGATGRVGDLCWDHVGAF